MFNFSQDKCSIAFIIASFFLPKGVCVCVREGERARECRKEREREGGRDREEVARERGREREMLP